MEKKLRGVKLLGRPSAGLESSSSRTMERDADLPDGDRRGAGRHLYRERQSGRSGQLAQQRVQRGMGARGDPRRPPTPPVIPAGIKLGIFDQPVYAKHPEFSGPDKVINLVTHGIREYTDPYIPVKKGDDFRYDGTLPTDSSGKLGRTVPMWAVSLPAAVTVAPCTGWRSTRRSSAPKTATPARKTALCSATMVRFIRPVGISWWPAARASSTTAGVSVSPKNSIKAVMTRLIHTSR